MAEKKMSMFKRMFERMKSQYMPVKSGQLFMTWDGTVVLKKVVGNDEMYIGVNSDNVVVSYEPEFIMDFPVYLIDRPYSQVTTKDIVLVNEGENAAMYGKVIAVTKNYIDVLCFNGNNLRMNKTRNVLTNSETICTVMNWLNLGNNNNMSNMFGGMNPMFILTMINSEGEKFDFGKLLPFMMMNNMNQNGKGNTMDPNMLMTLMLMNKGGEGSSNMMETIMMMNMMQNGGFTNMFGTCQGTPITEKTDKKPSSKSTKKVDENEISDKTEQQ